MKRRGRAYLAETSTISNLSGKPGAMPQIDLTDIFSSGLRGRFPCFAENRDPDASTSLSYVSAGSCSWAEVQEPTGVDVVEHPRSQISEDSVESQIWMVIKIYRHAVAGRGKGGQ